MWRRLTPFEQARLLGAALISAGLVALAVALGYFAYEIGSAQRQMPGLLMQMAQTSRQVKPVLDEVNAIRKLIPPILKEVAAVRETLPPLVATTASAINNASGAVHAIAPEIPAVLSEVRQTREALPKILAQADQVVSRAQRVGQEAGKGAVTGLLGGIVTAPFTVIGGVGRGLADILGLGGRSEFTREDDRLAGAATDAVVKDGRIGAKREWQNSDTQNRGSVTLLGQELRDGRPCLTLRQRVELRSGETHQADVELCRQPDGSWVETKR